MILMVWSKLFSIFSDFLNEIWPTYDPERYCIPKFGHDNRTKASGQSDIDWTKSKPVRGQIWTEIGHDSDGELDKNKQSWTRSLDKNEFGDRQDALTDEDVQALKTAGIDVRKGAQVKHYWAQGMTINETWAMFRGEKGYGRNIIAACHRIFNAPSPASVGK